MRLAIEALKWLAIAAFFYPLETIISSPSVSPCRKQIIKFGCFVIQIFFAFIVAVVYLDGLLGNSAIRSPLSLSGKIEICLIYMSAILSGSISRVASVVYRKDIANFFENLAFGCTNKITIDREKKLVLAFTTTLLYAIWFVGSTATAVQVDLGMHSWYENCSLNLLPCSQAILRYVFSFCDMWDMLSLLYSWAFIAIAGLAVVDRLDNFSMKYETIVKGLLGNRLEFKHGCINVQYDVLVQEYRRVRTNFELYSKIGGPYALALTVRLTLVCISFFSYVLAGSPTDNWFEYPLRMYVIVSPPCIVAIFYFGHYVSDAVSLLVTVFSFLMNGENLLI